MRKSMKIFAVASALVAGVAIAPALYAHDSERSNGSMMGPGMMDQGGMMGMMNMMGQMSQMVEHCNQVMGDRGSGQPNEQWRSEQRDAPKTPEKEG